MTAAATEVELALLTAPDDRQRQELAGLLVDAVAGGASVGWVSPPTPAEAAAFWDECFAEVAAGRRIVLVAVDEERIVGSVQLSLTPRPNSLHRGEVQKLLVHSSARRKGVGTALMLALEDEAVARERWLLVLDTIACSAAHHLYEKLGYVRAGVIPGFAKSTHGVMQTTAIYYRDLRDADPDHLGESAARHWDFPR